MTTQAGIFTLGCFYKNHQEVEFMSMYGSVTDAQVFSRELSDQEMVDITSCRCTSRPSVQEYIIWKLLPPGLLHKETSSAGTESHGASGHLGTGLCRRCWTWRETSAT